MIELHRFDVDYLDEEGWLKHIPRDDGDYVLAEDAIALEAKVAVLVKVIAESKHADELQRTIIALQAKIEKMEQSIGYVMRAWHHDRLHLPWSIHHLEEAYPKWKDRYPYIKAGE